MLQKHRLTHWFEQSIIPATEQSHVLHGSAQHSPKGILLGINLEGYFGGMK